MTTPAVPPFVGPENDYRSIAELDPGPLIWRLHCDRCARAGDLGDAAPLFDSLRLDARDLATPSVDAERTDAYGVGSSRKTTSADGVSSDVLQQAREAWMAFNPVSYS
jgi:hypothetical protein